MVDEIHSTDDDSDGDELIYRCPQCDSVVQEGSTRCLMCGTTLDESVFQHTTEATKAPPPPAFLRQLAEAKAQSAEPAVSEPAATTPISDAEADSPPPAETEPDTESQPVIRSDEPQTPVFRHIPEVIDDFNPEPIRPIVAPPAAPPSFRLFPEDKPQAPLVVLIVLFIIGTLCVGGFAFTNPDIVPIALVFTPTSTATHTAVPTNTPIIFPTDTATPTPEITDTPTITPTPLPTDTPQPPRTHTVTSGQTAVGIALFYDLTLGSIFELNDFNENTLLFEGQDILIPWPTATPPLKAIAVQLGEETIVVDPANCPPFYEIKEGDNLFQLAAERGVPLDAMLEINYRTIDSIVKPGDVICIPDVTTGPLPPTPGPSPTPSLTPAPQGPQLLYPAAGTVVTPPDQPFPLQWLAVKDLAENEWYMVELIDLTDTAAHPRRGFTQANAFRIPIEWRPADDNSALHQFQWQVSIIQVTGERADGRFTYTYGGRTSQPKTFYWQSQ